MSRDKGIVISDKHGVNPSVALCFFCGKENGCIVLPGRLPGDAEAPRQAVWDMTPCTSCASMMAQGIMLIQVRDEQPESDNPFRTGPICVVREEAVCRWMLDDALLAKIKRTRFAFVPQAAWRAIGLPEGSDEERP